MKKLIFEVLHEEFIPEENLLSLTGGAGNAGCEGVEYCYINIPSCPNLQCIEYECPTNSGCPFKAPICITNKPDCPYKLGI